MNNGFDMVESGLVKLESRFDRIDKKLDDLKISYEEGFFRNK